MSRGPNIPTRALASLVGLALCIAALSSCSTAAVEDTLLGESGCKGGPNVYLLVDTSKSTDGERRAGGAYETAVLSVVRETARRCGRLFAAPADGNAIANARWTIDGKSFTAALSGNAKLNAIARARKAARTLRPDIQRLLHRRITDGSDMLGALARAAITAQGDGKRRSELILLSDGALFVAHRYDLYHLNLTTPDQRRAFIGELRRMDELPKLGAFDAVYVGGVAVGVKGRDAARGILSFWQELVPEMGGKLESADSTLRYP